MDDLESFFSDVKQAEADATEATVAPMPVAVSSTIVAKPRGSSQIAGGDRAARRAGGRPERDTLPRARSSAAATTRARRADARAGAARRGDDDAPAVMPPPPLPVGDDARKHLPEGLTSHEGSLFLQQQSVYDHEAQARLASSLPGAARGRGVLGERRAGPAAAAAAGAASKPKKYVRRAEGKTWEDPSSRVARERLPPLRGRPRKRVTDERAR